MTPNSNIKPSPPSSKISQLLSLVTSKLKDLKRSNAAWEAAELLSFVTQKSHSWLIGHCDEALSPSQKRRFDQLLSVMIDSNLPLAYATGETTFCGLKIRVNHHVLIPRPETEILVRQVEKLISKTRSRVLEVGTGPGAIAIALADHCRRNNSRYQIVASDISKRALQVARQNVVAHNLESSIELQHSDLLRNVSDIKFDIIVANLPYLSPKDTKGLPDPQKALVGGPMGHELIERLMRQVAKLKYQPHYIVLEIGHDQGNVIKRLAQQILHSSRTIIIQDLNSWDRVALITLPAQRA